MRRSWDGRVPSDGFLKTDDPRGALKRLDEWQLERWLEAVRRKQLGIKVAPRDVDWDGERFMRAQDDV